ncbi:MAG TPA: putative metal-binding motif-containing protein [Myxococcota bacterium]|nr:putative metal-binding motif-containing protein [Myxococcota bacterium]
MKSAASAALCVAMALFIVACGGTGNPTDEGGADAVEEVAVTDANQDTSLDSVEDVRPDDGSGTNIGDAADVQTDQGLDAFDAMPDDVAPDDGADQGDTTIDPACENAPALEPGQALTLEALPETTPSIWDTYSCDPENQLTGPERVFFAEADCDGVAVLNLTVAGDSDSLPSSAVQVAVIDGCSPSDCQVMTAPVGMLNEEFEVSSGWTAFIVVESLDTGLPAFEIKFDLYCRACLDDDMDGYDACNRLFCPDGTDCNDDNAAINPGATETPCNGFDEDCDGTDDCQEIVCVDLDMDGFYNHDANACPTGTDCNDSNAAVNPGVTDVECNGVDENCDGIDWCPGSGQQCDPCLIGSGCLQDHICLPDLGGDFGVFGYCALICDGPTGCPAGATCVPDVHEGQGVCIADTIADCSGATLTLTDTCGNVVFEAACPGACNESAGICEESCGATRPASIGTTISGRLTAGQSGMSSYPGIREALGQEEVYSFTATCDGAAAVTLTEMADLELLLVVLREGCINSSAVASDTESGMVHEADFQVTTGVTYHVVVDSFIQDEAGPFNLLIDVECGQTGLQHCDRCRFDSQCASGYCDMPGEPPVTQGSCLADCAANGQCPPGSTCAPAGDGFFCMPDLTGECNGQALTVTDTCGLEYVLTTCPDGTDCNASRATCTDDCVDSDADGHNMYNAATCVSGDDCDDTNAAIGPGAFDVRCNEIDEDCSGADNCSDNTQCEPCDGGHCAEGYFCFVDPAFDAPGICLDNCTDDMVCPTDPSWDLSCWSWLSGSGDDSYYCRPRVKRSCESGDEVVTDGCGRVVQTNDCDVACFDNYGCLNRCTATQDHPGCGMTVRGTTVGAPDRTDYYYNYSTTVDDLTGPEVSYRFIASCTGEIAAVLEGDVDWLTLVVTKNFDQRCESGMLVDYGTFLEDAEVVGFNVVQGEEYTLIVDGMDGAAGGFSLTVNCLCGAGCTDADTDGFIDYHETNCPSGNDCDGTNASIRPGATEIECNGIDEDCSGYDLCSSNACAADIELGTLSAPVSGLACATSGTDDEITFYGGACSSPYPRFNVETVYHFKPACDGDISVTVSDPLTELYDIYLLHGECRADLCEKAAWVEMTAAVVGDDDYYLVIDGTAPSANTWTLDMSLTCAD